MRCILFSLFFLVAAACGEEPAGPPLVATDVVVLEPMAGMDMTAGYFVLENRGDETVRITAVASPQFGRVEMHETVIDDDVASMRPLDEIVLAAGERVAFEPGGMHLMLFQPSRPLDGVTLTFSDGNDLLLSVDTVATER